MEDRLVLFEALPPEQGAAVLSELKGETLRLVLHRAAPEKLGPQLDRVPGDEVTFLLERLPQRKRETLLEKMSPRDAAEAKRLLRYPERSAGRLMTEKFATVRPEWTVAEALEHLKRVDPEVETIQSLYAVNADGQLAGAVSLRKLFRSPPEKKIAELMNRNVRSVHPDAPQEEVARLVSKYDIHSIPVVDDQNRPLGIVTVDDVIDVLIEEQTEDMLHLAGMPAEEEVTEGYFATKPWRNVRARFNWLLLLFVTETLTGTVLRHFESGAREGRRALLLHPAAHRDRRQLRLPDRHDDRAGPRRGRDQAARFLARHPARGGQRPGPGHPARHRRLRARAPLGLDDAAGHRRSASRSS